MINREELMTVGQLIQELQNQDEDAIVAFEQPTHDHWGTIAVASPFTVEEKVVKFKEYHNSMVLVGDAGVDEDDDPETWVILSE